MIMMQHTLGFRFKHAIMNTINKHDTLGQLGGEEVEKWDSILLAIALRTRQRWFGDVVQG